MGWDGAGAYNRQHNFSADASSGIKILAARMDQELDDVASAMTIALTKNGQNVPTQNLPMGGFRHINVGAPTSVNNYMRSREFIENIPVFMDDTASSADRISVSAQYFTSVSANQAPGDGTRILVRALSDKTSAVLYLNGHSANVEFQDGTRAGATMVSGGIYELLFSSVDVAWKITRPDDARTAQERTAGVTPTNYQYEPGDIRRYGAVSGADSTTAIQSAINTTHGVIVRGALAVYYCAGLTQSTDGQSFHFYDGARLQKNANSAVLTCTGHDVEFHSLRVEGDGANFTGVGVSLAGNRNTLVNCAIQNTASTALISTGQALQLLGNRGIYFSLDSGASAYDIVVGVSGTATLYHRLVNVYTSSSFGGIRFIDCGGQSVVGSQFGKLFIDSGTSPAGVNGGMYVGNRIIGAAVIEISGALFSANQFASTITIAASVSGVSIDETNSHTGGVPSITNNGNPDNYWSYSTSTALRHSSGVTVPNAASYALEGTSPGTDGLLVMSVADNLGITNEASGKGVIITQAGSGTINMDVNGARSMQVDANNTAGNTRFLIYDVDNATLERVTVGAADSGGLGYKVLRIPN